MITRNTLLREPLNRFVADQFLDRVGCLLTSDLCIDGSSAEHFVGTAAQIIHRGKRGFDLIARGMQASGIRDRWNRVLALARSSFLADWIAPHVTGNLLDLLCGEGKVGEELARLGLDVTLVERELNYHCDRSLHSIRFVPMEERKVLENGPKYGTVLLCTVLHHEDDPEALLALGAQLAKQRLIIVENCIEKRYSAEYHALIDFFFNQCLNETSLRSPGSHKLAAEWVHAVSRYGQLLDVARKERVPGVPLPHHLIVVEIT